jgi:hypothetical protein
MESQKAFGEFVNRRGRLNKRIDASRVDLDVWMATHANRELSLEELTEFEFLLQSRRDVLAELVKLDDEIMDHLLEMRRHNQRPTLQT